MPTTTTTTIAGNRAPDCHAAVALPDELWPPNHRLVPVTVAGVVDPDGDPLLIEIVGITQDEPLDASGGGSACPDGAGVGRDTAMVRAERLGAGDGRVYHVGFAADDGHGGRCEGTVAVCVPHDQRGGHVCVDQGSLFDSTRSSCLECAHQCGIEVAMAGPVCTQEGLPRVLARRLAKARVLLARVATGSSEKAVRVALPRAMTALKQAGRTAMHAVEKEKISAARAEQVRGCLASALNHAADGSARGIAPGALTGRLPP